MQKSSVEVTEPKSWFLCTQLLKGDILAAEEGRNQAGIFVRFISKVNKEELQGPMLTVTWKEFWDYLRNSLNRVEVGRLSLSMDSGISSLPGPHQID